jgi:hypothetical protein
MEISWPLRSTVDLPEAIFAQLREREDLRYIRHGRCAVPHGAPPPIPRTVDTILNVRTDRGEFAVRRQEHGAIALLNIQRGNASIEVAAGQRELADRVWETLAAELGAVDAAEGNVPLTFWAMGPHSPRPVRRLIEAPAWSMLAGNYAKSTSLAVAKLITARVPDSGRLLLWHGEPGTGKTYALRALSRVWGDWCSTHFITDPETFLGHGTSYLLDVLSAEHHEPGESPRDWKLIVLEDCGELLSADARERSGQALSRLLNLTDGLLGQGMNAIVLVSTNEPLRKLHAAVQRPGRCWSDVEFSSLSPAEANMWLAAHDSAARVTQPACLAELYTLLKGRAARARVAFGFAQ